MVVRLCFLDGSLYLFYIMELAVTARDILELIAYQPYILQTGSLQLVNYLLMFLVMDVPHKMAILGQMGELGEVSHEEHQKVVDQLQAAGLENVWLVGDEFKDIPCSYRKFQNVEEVKEALKANQPHDHYILIKGSNSVKLFQLPELL